MICYNIPQEVTTRKNKVDIKGLQQLLKEHKNISNKEISDKLNLSKTTIDHWFRRDDSFAVPDPEYWYKLKEILNIKTNKYDNQITEFIKELSNYDMSNRVYDSDGIAPTLTQVSGGNQEKKILVDNPIILDAYNKTIKKDNISTTLRTNYTTGNTQILNNKKIRKLTPKECFRLMGFLEDQINLEGISNSQLYKLAGNGWEINVVSKIFKRLI